MSFENQSSVNQPSCTINSNLSLLLVRLNWPLTTEIFSVVQAVMTCLHGKVQAERHGHSVSAKATHLAAIKVPPQPKHRQENGAGP